MSETAELLAILARPTLAAGLRPSEWSRLIAVARSANLLGALAERLEAVSDEWPADAARHLDGARQLSQRQQLSVVWEAHCLQAALEGLGTPVVLLKGAAYVLGYPEIARGRLFGDIDILVPRVQLGNVESQLMLGGWASAKQDAYDQRYYRQWMHELPPMVNVHRGTVMDVHHTILPLSARNTPDPSAIIDRAVPVEGLPALRVPCPEDLLIHSITHLMHEGELHNGLRDLHDIDRMVRMFTASAGFWTRLVSTAAGNDLALPVAHGLRLARRLFGTSIPDDILERLVPGFATRSSARVLARVYLVALQSPQAARRSWAARASHGAIYLRGHWLRMPPLQLLRHLATKAWKSATQGRRA
ncbi:MAG: nucleotidyltransferase family protein [Rubrivivax sp.]|nr:nucleotidyltransferase family protein [Rubrivivax sp.]